MKDLMNKLERLLEIGGTKKDIVLLAISGAALTWLITGEIIRAVTILVVFCPCAMVLATPAAIMAATLPWTRRPLRWWTTGWRSCPICLPCQSA